MTNWIIAFYDHESSEQLAKLFYNQQGKYDEDIRNEINRILNLLASQNDPRHPSKSTGLIVDELEHDAPGWFRVKVGRYAIRVIFRLLVLRRGKLLKLPIDELPGEDEKKYIDIVRLGRHPDVYGKGLRDRYKKLGG